MQKWIASVFLLGLFLVAGVSFASAQETQSVGVPAITGFYQQLIEYVTGDWQGYGQLFTKLQGEWFRKIFLVLVTAIPAVFLLHFLIIGAKHFDHDGEQIPFFSLFNRVVHFFAAISFSTCIY